VDLAVSGLFFTPHAPLNFMLRGDPVALGIQEVIQRTSRGIGFVFGAAAIAAVLRRKPVFGLGPRAYIFLLLALGLGPGLLTNTVFKDEWHRARPLYTIQFGGDQQFTPALIRSDQCDRNCSFFSGDAAFVFYLHSFAYVVRRRQRTVLYGTLGVGALVGLMRMAQGGHYLSDVVFAALFMLASTALVHLLVFGLDRSRKAWRVLAGASPA
jgi:lipid A 4'-phosphatase